MLPDSSSPSAPQTKLLTTLMASLLLGLATPLAAQERVPAAPTDVLSLDTQVSGEVSPDLAVVTLAVDREGPDPAVLSRDINQILTRALAQAKAVPGVTASSGGYNTFPRHDNKGKRIGWQLRAEVILKSADFGALGQLAGRLASDMVISGSGFEVSPALRATEEARLINAGAAAFHAKATSAVKAFGYNNYRIREIQLGSAGQQPGPRAIMMRSTAKSSDESVALPLESGRVTMSLSVSGSVQMQR